jgi:hypothetical protein
MHDYNLLLCCGHFTLICAYVMPKFSLIQCKKKKNLLTGPTNRFDQPVIRWLPIALAIWFQNLNSSGFFSGDRSERFG